MSDSNFNAAPAQHEGTLARAAFNLFMGQAPDWYKHGIIIALLINPLILFLFGGVIAGWLLLAQFVATLALALRCYPLQPGGLLALEAILMGLATPAAVAHEVEANFSVILLLIFMVAGIYFLRDLLLYLFTNALVRVRSKIGLSLFFCSGAALLSAFLDALTVIAVVITAASGFYAIYHKVASGRGFDDAHDHEDDELIHDPRQGDLTRFRLFLQSLVMHAAVGTTLGGICTLVGEPQNLLIGETLGWSFVEFFLRMAPLSIPVLVIGLLTCALLERFALFGYGERMPESVREILRRYADAQRIGRSHADRIRLLSQFLVAVFLVIGLLFHLAEVGLIGLTVIVLATTFCGITDEKKIGPAFEAALPFTALLVAFFAIVAMIQQQHLFEPLIRSVLALQGSNQLAAMYLANGALSAISDNVFVATIYITEAEAAHARGLLSRESFELMAIAINAGTNIPSVATPNGQAAFLFLLTSSLAPLIRLGYMRMVWMALPYTVVLTSVGLIAIMRMG